MTIIIISLIESKLTLQWSPEQISGWLKAEKENLINHERIYLHIWQDKRSGSDMYTHLCRQGEINVDTASQREAILRIAAVLKIVLGLWINA